MALELIHNGLYMNEYLSNDAIDNLVLLAISAFFMLIFWILESAWRNDRRWIPPVLIFPPIILAFIYNYWEETRAKCFFVALYFVTITLLSGVTGYNFIYRVGLIIARLAFWPYYAFDYIKSFLV